MGCMALKIGRKIPLYSLHIFRGVHDVLVLLDCRMSIFRDRLHIDRSLLAKLLC